MSKQNNWENVRDWITERIDSGDLPVGEALPTEPELQKVTGAGRHSLRRAIASLAAEGRISVEQGRGSFVCTPPEIIYRIGQRTRFSETIRSQGLKPSRDPISAEIVPAPHHVAEMLQLNEGALVSRVVGRGLANNVPISISIGWASAHRFPDMGDRRMRQESVTNIYLSYGIKNYQRRETKLMARKPEKWESRILQQPMDSPVIETEKIDIDPDGTPIGCSESVWAAGRVRFLISSIQSEDV